MRGCSAICRLRDRSAAMVRPSLCSFVALPQRESSYPKRESSCASGDALPKQTRLSQWRGTRVTTRSRDVPILIILIFVLPDLRMSELEARPEADDPRRLARAHDRAGLHPVFVRNSHSGAVDRALSAGCLAGCARYSSPGIALTSLRRRLRFGLKPNREPGSAIARGLVGVTVRYGMAWWYPRPGHRPGGYKIDARRAASTHRRSRQLACLSSERCHDKQRHDELRQAAP